MAELPKIVYEDNHVIVVVKPPNMLSQADKTKDADLLSMVMAIVIVMSILRQFKEKADKPLNN